jgi:hypothetical protein
MGFYLDVLVEFVIRAITRGVRLLRSRHWPFVLGSATSAEIYPSGVGCAKATVKYEYNFDGENFVGAYKKPFLWTASAKKYADEHTEHSRFGVRVKPGRPSISVPWD